MGGLQKSDLIILAGRPGMGKTALATNIAYNVAKAFAPGDFRADGTRRNRQRRGRRLLLAGNVGRAARDPHHRRTNRNPVQQDPARRDQRSRFRKYQGHFDRAAETCRSMSTRPAVFRSGNSRRARAGSSGNAASISWSSTISSSCRARPVARAKTACRKSPKSPPGSRRSPRSSTCPIVALLAIVAAGRVPRGQTTSTCRTCVNPARSNRTPTLCCSCTVKSTI